MKTVDERLGGGYGVTLGKLHKNGFATDQNMANLIDDILKQGNTFAARQSFLLLQAHLSPDELETFTKRSEYAFIIAVSKEIKDLVKQGVIRSVWAFNESGSLPEGKDEEFAKETCAAALNNSDLYEWIKEDAREASALLFKSLHSAQGLFASTVTQTIPEKKVTTLLEHIENFIRFISELISGKTEEKESPIAALSRDAESWKNKVVGDDATEIER